MGSTAIGRSSTRCTAGEASQWLGAAEGATRMLAEAVPTQRALGPWWVVASAVAAAVGIAVGRPLAELPREPFSQILGGLPTVALFGAFFGLCLGLGHTL